MAWRPGEGWSGPRRLPGRLGSWSRPRAVAAPDLTELADGLLFRARLEPPFAITERRGGAAVPAWLREADSLLALIGGGARGEAVQAIRAAAASDGTDPVVLPGVGQPGCRIRLHLAADGDDALRGCATVLARPETSALPMASLSRVLECASDMALLVREDGGVVFANTPALEFAADAAAELPFLGIWGAAAGEDPARVFARLAAAEQAGRPLQGRDRAGRLQPLMCRSIVLEDDAERPVLHLITATEASRAPDGPTDLDPVTGMISGASLVRTLDAELAAAGAALRGRSMILIDLDQYPVLAETYTVAQADFAMAVIARRLAECLPEGSVAGAFGERAIAVLTTQALVPTAEEQPQLQALYDAVAGDIVLPESGDQVYLNPALGVALFPDHGDGARALLVQARLAAERAAGQRPAKWAFHRARDEGIARRRVAMDGVIERGVAREEFGFRYVPRFGASTGRLTGVEQQVVWHHPHRGLVLPDRLLDERHMRYLHELLKDRVLNAALEQWRSWSDQGFQPGTLSLKLPERLLESDRLVTRFKALLRRYRVPPTALAIELAGEASPAELGRIEANLAELRDAGVGLTLANVGRGRSMLEQIQRLPLDALKLDALLVRGVPTERAATALAKASCALAQGLGVRLIADGVKSVEQLRFLVKNGCDEYQGPLVSDGIEAAELPLRFPGGLAPTRPAAGANEAEALPSVVVVDDEQRLLRAVQRELRRGPWVLHTFDRPAEALAFIAAQPVALLITDQRMPDMTGVELIRRVREVSPETVRIIMSAHTDVGTLASALNQGALFRFMGKPWDRQALRQIVSEGIAAYRGEEAG